MGAYIVKARVKVAKGRVIEPSGTPVDFSFLDKKAVGLLVVLGALAPAPEADEAPASETATAKKAKKGASQ